jgi:branched-chain amino acid transport system ATP-binding protein
VPEDRRIFGTLTVAENLAVGRQPARPGAPTWSVERVIELFPGLAPLTGRLASQISGGEQQMLTIARTLMGNPEVMLLDEPSEGLAPLIVAQLGRAINAMKAQGLSVLVSEQNLKLARAISDRAYIVEKGRIRFDGTIAELDANAAIGRAYLAV